MFDNIENRRFGRLIAKERAGKKWLCVCDCGNEKLINPSNLKRGLTKSCGCLNREMTKARNTALVSTHRMSKTPEYKIWQGMRQRCENQKDKSFEHYGARGVTVCERWHSFENFFMDMGERPSAGHSIDRIDVNGHYEPYNCRWATVAQQARNRTNNIFVDVGGSRMCLADAFGPHSPEYQRERRRLRREVSGQCP